MAKINVKFKKLSQDAKLPKYAHKGDLGMDVISTSLEYDAETDTYIYGTGLACETKNGVGILGMVRSSNYKTDSYLTNGVGLIDSALYRGEIQLRYKNRTSMNARIELDTLRAWSMIPWYKKIFTSYKNVYKKIKEHYMLNALQFAPYSLGMRCGQLVILEFPETSIKNAKKLSETERGEGGFGSTKM